MNPIWRPYTQEQTAHPPILLERAQGAYLYTKSGAKIFDGISSWWLITNGHCHPQVVEAIQRQAAKIDQVTFANFSHAPAEELADQLIKLTPTELTRVFYSDNGSTAVEVALKMAIQAATQSGQAQRRRFLAFKGAYHGDTVGAMSLSGESAFNRPYRPTLFDVVRADHPTRSDAPVDDYIRDFERLIAAQHQTLAGVIIEPLLQGAGGMTVWPPDAVVRIAQLCRQHGIYLIFDEVMTGFGRTGTMFAMDRLGVTPDLLCLSKGLTGGTLPLAVTLAREEIYQAFLSEDRDRMFFHGHSFTGNPIACAAAVANLKVFDSEKTIARIGVIEQIHRQELHTLAAATPITDPRICGSVAAFELGGTDGKDYFAGSSHQITAAALTRGLFIRPLGNTIYLMPPYCCEAAELREVWSTLKTAILPP